MLVCAQASEAEKLSVESSYAFKFFKAARRIKRNALKNPGSTCGKNSCPFGSAFEFYLLNVFVNLDITNKDKVKRESFS